MEQRKNTKIATSQNADFINFEELLQKSIKNWKWFVISIIACVLIAFIYVKVTPKTYQLTANILIKMEDKGMGSKMGSMAKMFDMGGLSSSDNIEDEVGIMSSHTLMRQMAMDLGLHIDYKEKGFFTDDDLYNNSPIIADIDKSILDTLTAGFTFKVAVNKDNTLKIKVKIGDEKLGTFDIKTLPYILHTNYGDVTFKYSENQSLELPYTLLITICGRDFAAEQFQKIVSVGAISKKSNIIGLSTNDNNIPRGKDILNTLIKLYNEDALDDKNKAALNTEKFIGERLDLLVHDLSLIEKSVESYKRDNQLIDIGAEAGMSMSRMVKMKELDVQYEIQLGMVKMIEDYVKNPSNKYKLLPVGMGIPGEVSGQIGSYNELLLQRIALLRDINATNPVVLSLNEQLDLMQKNILASIETVKKDLNKTKDSWRAEENLLLSRVKELPKQEREFVEIQRQQKVKSELYLFLLQKHEENALTLASSTPKAKIIDEAFAVSKPVWPRKMIILAVAMMIACCLPIVVFILKDILTFKIEDKSQLERLTSIPVLGEVCKDKSGESVVVKEGITSSVAELFRLIRTNIRFVLTKPEEKVIIITSSISGEGKSFFVINFSMSLSLMKNKKVAMIGLDIRNPKLAEYLSLPTSKGITTFMASETMKPEEVVIQSGLHPNLWIVPAGPVPPNPAELLLSERLDEMFDYLRENFDYVVVDTAPVGMVSDTFTLDRVSDATIYLCRANYTHKSHLKLVESIVAEGRLKKLSLVINGTTTKSSYGYGYGSQTHNK